MSAFASEVGPVLIALAMGWLALWPARTRLGPAGYHLSALSVGLIGWCFVGIFTTVTSGSFDALSTIAGATILALGCWVIERLTRGVDTGGSGVPLGSFVVTAAGLGIAGLVFSLGRLTVSNNDSIMSYWPLGVALQRDGVFTAEMVATRSVLIPSIHAGHVMLGSEWVHVVYALIAVAVILWTAALLLWGPLAGAQRWIKRSIIGGAFTLLLLESSFLYHSFFVHSHMISALYLLVALGATWTAARPVETEEHRPLNTAYLLVAGLAAGALALTRADGLAYVFVPVVAALSLLIDRRSGAREVVAFFAPLLFVVYGVYGSIFATVGMWPADKLDGTTALAILVLLGASSLVPWLVHRLPLAGRGDGERLFASTVVLGMLALASAYFLRQETASLAFAHSAINLFGGRGGYGPLWYIVVALFALSVVTGDALRRRSWTRPAFLSVILFFILAALVHATSHPGRLGVGDSFTRVSFHAFPLVVFYLGAVSARILTEWRPAREAAGAAEAALPSMQRPRHRVD